MTYELQPQCSQTPTESEPIVAVLSPAEFGLPLGTVFVGFSADEMTEMRRTTRKILPNPPPQPARDRRSVEREIEVEFVVCFVLTAIVMAMLMSLVAIGVWWISG